MPLSTAAPGLEADIFGAFQTSRDRGSSGGADSDTVILGLSVDLSVAMNTYASQALVKTDVSVPPGQSDAPGLGITQSEGKGSGVGSITLIPVPLQAGFESAFKKARDAGANDSADSDSIIRDLSGDLTDRYKEFLEAGIVNTQDTIFPGQVSLATNPALSQPAGSYTSPQSGAGVGTVRMPTDETSKCKSEIEKAFKKSRDEGKSDGANSDKIIADLAADLKDAIDEYTKSARVETNDQIFGGASVAGYLALPPALSPVPSFSLPSAGTGKGQLT
jgi:hypothetical protein